MSGVEPGVTLVCPGLLGPLPLIPEPLPKTPVLDRWLARGRRAAAVADDPDRTCLEAAGICLDAHGDVPSGVLSLLGEDSDLDLDGVWMHADPVHLRPDRDQLLVFGGDAIEPTPDEASELVDTFNAHFADAGLRLVAPVPARWYLHSVSDFGLRTSPLREAQGGSMAAHLPEGVRASEWMRLMNEVQMLFHASPVNARRESRGRPAINGLWTWGTGRLPAPSTEPPSLVVGEHPLTRGLARLAGVQHLSVTSAWSRQIPGRASAIVLIESLSSALMERDLWAWAQGLESLEARAAELDARLRRSELNEIVLDPCLGTRWSVRAVRLSPFWRRGGLAKSLVVGIQE